MVSDGDARLDQVKDEIRRVNIEFSFSIECNVASYERTNSAMIYREGGLPKGRVSYCG